MTCATSSESWSGRTSCSRISTTRSTMSTSASSSNRRPTTSCEISSAGQVLLSCVATARSSSRSRCSAWDPTLGRGVLFGELLPQLARDAGRRGVRAVCAERRRVAVPLRSRRRPLLRRGGLPARARRRATCAGRFCGRVPGDCERPRREIARGCGLGRRCRRRPALEGGCRPRRGCRLGFRRRPGSLPRRVVRGRSGRASSDRPSPLSRLSRAVSGEVMAEVFGEWRRRESPCTGGIVLWLRDLAPGAGWGLIDSSGTAKAAYHHLRRILAPVAVWTTDEGLGGIDVHLANDGPGPVVAQLRVALYRDQEHQVAEAEEKLVLPAHTQATRDVEGLLGRFARRAYATASGPPGHDVVVASLERDGQNGRELLSQAFRFPAGRPIARESAAELGLEAEAVETDRGIEIRVSSRLSSTVCGSSRSAPPRPTMLSRLSPEASVRCCCGPVLPGPSPGPSSLR